MVTNFFIQLCKIMRANGEGENKFGCKPDLLADPKEFSWRSRPDALGKLFIAGYVVVMLTISSFVSLGHSAAGVLPLAQVLETKIIEKGEDSSKGHDFSFNVPEAGYATLRLTNGARTDAPLNERVEAAKVKLNGEVVVTREEFNQRIDVLDVPVELRKGINKLKVRLKTNSGERIAVRIDAPADTIVLNPVLNAVEIDGEPLRAKATVTGLALPVQNAKVRFQVNGLGGTIEGKGVTSNGGIATAFVSGLSQGEGVLRAQVAETNLWDQVRVAAVGKRALTMAQRPDSLRIEAGSVKFLTFNMNVRDVEGDQHIVKLEHVVKPNPSGIGINSRFPPEGRIIKESQMFSASPAVTGIIPGIYTITTTASVTGRDTVSAREIFSTELMVEVVESRTPDPLILSKPIISPSAIPPSSELTRVAFGTTIVGLSNPPQVVFLEKVTNDGELISQETELRDDGEKPDAKAGDGFYSGALQLGNKEETENYFRLRIDYFGKIVLSDIVGFPITRIPLGYRASNSDMLVISEDGRDKLYANEVIVGTFASVSPRRVQTIVAEVGKNLEVDPKAISIEGYIPSIDAYLVEFQGNGTLQGVNQIISLFQDFSEIKYASPNFKGSLASSHEWYLNDIGVKDLRAGAAVTDENSSLYGQTPLYGDNTIGVAVLDNGVHCNHQDLNGKCGPAPPMPAICNGVFASGGATNAHGSKVAALIAGQSDNGNSIQGVDGGVAWNTQLYPFFVDNGQWQLNVSIDCARQANAMAASQIIHILNVSIAASNTPALETSVCQALCANMLLVAAAGNHVCELNFPVYPASYNDESITCSCGSSASNGILDVGGSDTSGARGWRPSSSANPVCNNLADPFSCYCSADGELYAPGWGVPDPNPLNTAPINYGTSWAAPLVSGCAAIRGAVQQEWSGEPWDADAVETRLRNNSFGSPPLLNCLSAVEEPYDIVFVLDRSGSMGQSNGMITRWGALTDAVNVFSQIIETTAPPGSNVGLTLFATTVLPEELEQVSNTISSPGLVLVDDFLASNVNNILPMQSPSGWTAMGSGLQDAIDNKVTNAARTRVVVLFTDGEQNQNPLVNGNGCGFSDNTSIRAGCPSFPDPAPSGTVKIITVGILQPGSLYLSTLQELAKENRGSTIITSEGTNFDFIDPVTGLNVGMGTIDDAFAFAIAPALYGNSPQMVTSYREELSNPVKLPPFDLNKYVSQLLINLSFSQKFGTSEWDAILADVRIMKDGVDITPFFQPVFVGNQTNSVLLKTNFVDNREDVTDTISPEGRYTIHIAEPVNHGGDLSYRVVPYADDHRLDMEWEVNPALPRVNESFTPTVRLSWRGQAVTNANVKAWILKPGDDLGDLLANNPQRVDPSNAPDAGSPGYQKYLHLIKNDPEFLAQLHPAQQELILSHQGDGQYSAAYTPGDVSGVYQVLYQVIAEDPEFGKIQRLAAQSVYTRFGDIDLDKSAVSNTVKDNNVRTITFRPFTTNGRFIGPGQERAISVDGTGIKLSNVKGDQFGKYRLTLVGDPNAHISIKLLGEEIYQGPASMKKDFLCDWLRSLGLPSILLWFLEGVLGCC